MQNEKNSNLAGGGSMLKNRQEQRNKRKINGVGKFVPGADSPQGPVPFRWSICITMWSITLLLAIIGGYIMQCQSHIL